MPQGIVIIPEDEAVVTMLELLEDFADASTSWVYLEEESALYATLKGVPACVIRYVGQRTSEDCDLAFAASQPDEGSAMQLLLVEPGSPRPVDEAERQQVADRFVDGFTSYTRRRPGQARLQNVFSRA